MKNDSSRKVNTGELLQEKVQAAFKEYSSENKAFGYRFYDSKSTQGGFLPAQPGDFFLLVPNHCILVECKSTIIGTRVIPLAYHGDVGKRQIAKHRLWARAEHPSVYIWLDMETKTIEWHHGKNVVKKIDNPLVTCKLSELLKSIPGVLSLL